MNYKLLKTFEEVCNKTVNKVNVYEVSGYIYSEDGSKRFNKSYKIENHVAYERNGNTFRKHFSVGSKKDLSNHYPDSLCILGLREQAQEYINCL